MPRRAARLLAVVATLAAVAGTAAANARATLPVADMWRAKTLFTPRDHLDLQAEPSADAAHG